MVRLESSARAPRRARREISELLARAGRTDLVDAAELIVDELVTDAVLHGSGPITFSATYTAGTLRVGIEDCSARPPVLRQPQDYGESGRGLLLVEGVAASWGNELRPGGKVIWLELH